MKIAVKNFDNQQVREIDLPEEVFGYPYKSHLIHEAVQAYLAGLRSGTHKVKNRSEVSGSGRKLWRQKGTGRARTKDIRNPKWRKGGTVHGPVPHSHAKDLSRREKKNALKSALSRKLADQEIVVVESLAIDSLKTKALLERLGKLGVAGRKALLVDSRDNESLALASRNVKALKAVDALAVNVYDVVDRSLFVVSEDALNRLVEVLAK
jgi:large subunit ribosomal protein L4